MARRCLLPCLALLALSAPLWPCAFVAPPPAAAAITAGLSPLAFEQPAGAYDSVVAMLQSWLVGGTVLAIIFAAVIVASTANPLTKRRAAVAAQVEGKQ